MNNIDTDTWYLCVRGDDRTTSILKMTHTVLVGLGGSRISSMQEHGQAMKYSHSIRKVDDERTYSTYVTTGVYSVVCVVTYSMPA